MRRNGDLETTEVASHLKFFDIECGLASIATNWVIHSLGVKLLQPNPVFVFALSDLKYSTFVSSLTPHMYIYREHIPPRFLAPPDVVGFWFLLLVCMLFAQPLNCTNHICSEGVTGIILHLSDLFLSPTPTVAWGLVWGCPRIAHSFYPLWRHCLPTLHML